LNDQWIIVSVLLFRHFVDKLRDRKAALFCTEFENYKSLTINGQ
jgi:hypothetical protein